MKRTAAKKKAQSQRPHKDAPQTHRCSVCHQPGHNKRRHG